MLMGAVAFGNFWFYVPGYCDPHFRLAWELGKVVTSHPFLSPAQRIFFSISLPVTQIVNISLISLYLLMTVFVLLIWKYTTLFQSLAYVSTTPKLPPTS